MVAMSDLQWGGPDARHAIGDTYRRLVACVNERARRWIAGVTVGIVAGALTTVQTASAGTYVMHSCEVPGHLPGPISPWRSVPARDTTLVSGCAAGTGFQFALSEARNMAYPSRASLDLRVPPDAALGAVSIERVRAWVDTRLGTTARILKADMRAVQDPAGLVNLPDGLSALQSPTELVLPPGTKAVQVSLLCTGSDRQTRVQFASPTDCYARDIIPLHVRGIEATLREDVSPSASAVGGTLLRISQRPGFEASTMR